MTPEKLDAKQLNMVQKAVPVAPKWAQRVRSDLPGLFSQDMVLSIVYYHIVDQARLYKDKDIGLYFNALKLRMVSLVKESLCYEISGRKRDSTKSKQEGKRAFKSAEIVHLDGLDQELLSYEDRDLDKVLLKLEQGVLVKKALKAISPEEQLIIFKIYFLGESWAEIAQDLGYNRNQGSKIMWIEKKALKKMRDYLDGGDIAC